MEAVKASILEIVPEILQTKLSISIMLFLFYGSIFIVMIVILRSCFQMKTEDFDEFYTEESRFLITDIISEKQKQDAKFIKLDMHKPNKGDDMYDDMNPMKDSSFRKTNLGYERDRSEDYTTKFHYD